MVYIYRCVCFAFIVALSVVEIQDRQWDAARKGIEACLEKFYTKKPRDTPQNC